MAEITAALVNELRQETGAGMMDCKKALAETAGNKEKAIEYLRKKGMAAAAKRADRSAEQGLVTLAQSQDGRTAALVEVNSETDFVAKNDMFRTYAKELADIVLAWKDADGKTADDLKELKMASGLKVGDVLADMVGKIGEKLVIGKFARVHCDNGYIGSYIHSDAKLGVLVALEGITAASPEAGVLGRDLSMQVAASAPVVVRREEVPAEKIDAERAIEIDRARTEGKPEAAVAKIAEGRINKWFAEVALLEQPFVKDPKVAIRDVIAEAAKKTGTTITVKSFTRIRVGS